MMKWVQRLGFFILFLSTLSGCGGSDTPFTLVDPKPPTNGGGGVTPPVQPPAGGGGCVVTLNSTVRMKTQLATELIQSDPKPLPPIKMRFNGNKVRMAGDDFQEGEIVLGTRTIK
ncbi:MAG: hypothetical protein JNK65_10125, partial [Deltaproteobacteria bacterium]|nr:hypothetical protein [Deltaproteobacteria bacterium]